MFTKASKDIKLRLHYWNFRGRVQTVRYILEDIAYIHKNVDYKEEFELLENAMECWPTRKTDEKISGSFQNLPVLHWNEKNVFGQTLTIGQLLARKFDLYGKLTVSIDDIDLLQGYIDGVVSCAYTDVISNVLLCIWDCINFEEDNYSTNITLGKISNSLKIIERFA